ncbi:hypothetical protein CCACVL1_11486 [Corchorus capsularis]|uniref:Ethylene-responsive nuclear family protein n=1 Tax=Corchorus capsularis TaxID=210143 RepID=A0A1R3IKY8_COCAP|nr:hypothetical protein CCACVL1_11486 [Corchorus capsularis]
MPNFPWKKAKVNRISRLVADLHQSPKRGGSLVVETGFPTSLIDLFVKNRDRLRKQTSKRKSGLSPRSQSQIHPVPQSVPSLQQKEAPSPEIEVGDLVLVERDECADERIAFPAGFKVFLAVALAVSTPTLAVWIMAAAFLLLLLEFVGTRYFRFLRPQSQFLFLASWVRKRWDWDWDLEQQESRPELVADQKRVEEIEIEESKSDSMEKVSESEIEMLGKRIEVLINESERVSSSSRKAQIKANLIKKLVPKKLRKGKKQGNKKKNNNKNDDKDDGSCNVTLETLMETVEEDDESQVGVEEVDLEIEEEEDNDEEGGGRISTCSVQSLGIELEKENSTAAATATAETAVERKVKSSESGYMILILFGTVLGGLLGGRGFALLLTLVWCLIVRYSINCGFGRFRLRRRTETGKTTAVVLSRCLASKRLSG